MHGKLARLYRCIKIIENPAFYCPVSLTSLMSKSLEKIIRTDVVARHTIFSVITKSHYGFVSRKCTTTNLLEWLND